MNSSGTDGLRSLSSHDYGLPPNVVLVWRIYLDRDPADFGVLEGILSADELERARRFHFERDRRRFTIARGALRVILGGHLNVDPKLVAFDYGPQGKPFLWDVRSGIRFNVAHSGEVALLAITLERELGVDVEQVRPLAWIEQIPERFFSPREAAAFRSLPSHLLEAAFFACWTRKEAYIKARGGGMSIPLDSFDVSLRPDETPALLDVRENPLEASRWSLIELQAPSGYAAALVVQGKDWNLQCREWF